MKIIEDIDFFFNYLDSHLSSISEIKCSKNVDLYKKLVYMAFIDLLSRIVFPKKSPRDRVISVLKRFSKWNNGYNVSLPHLLRFLSKTPDPAFEGLRLYVKTKFKSWSSGELVTLDRDLDYEETKKLWPQEKEYKIPIEDVSLDSLTHFHLFYSYRNSLVHELRPPSTSFDREHHQEPFYMHLTNFDAELKPKEHHWVLNYPIKFFDNISRTLHKEIKEYFVKNEINPYDLFIFGEYWLESLNKK